MSDRSSEGSTMVRFGSDNEIPCAFGVSASVGIAAFELRSQVCQLRTMLRPEHWRARAFGFWDREQGGTLGRVGPTSYGRTSPMVEQKIRFDDGAAYEQMMGIWSWFAGEVFLDWLAPPSGLRWIDIGCGTGAFTELLVERCAPVEVQGIDPSEGRNSPLHAHDSRCARRSFARAMPWPFPSTLTGSTQP